MKMIFLGVLHLSSLSKSFVLVNWNLGHVLLRCGIKVLFGSLIPCFRSETKENERVIERQTLSERLKNLQQEHERLLDAQVSLNQREDHIFGRSQELAELEKGLESARTTFEEDRRAFEDKKSNLEIALASLAKREEVCIRISICYFWFCLIRQQKSSKRLDSMFMFYVLAKTGCL